MICESYTSCSLEHQCSHKIEHEFLAECLRGCRQQIVNSKCITTSELFICESSKICEGQCNHKDPYHEPSSTCLKGCKAVKGIVNSKCTRQSIELLNKFDIVIKD